MMGDGIDQGRISFSAWSTQEDFIPSGVERGNLCITSNGMDTLSHELLTIRRWRFPGVLNRGYSNLVELL